MSRLYILRHGQAEIQARSDAERPLTAAGWAEIGRIADTLMARGIHFDCALVSPYRRAQESADELLARIPAGRRETESCITPDVPPWQAEALCRMHREESLLLVSHMPLVARLCAELSPGTGILAFPTAGLAILEADGDVWRFQELLVP